MIVRDEPDSWLLIRQPDHARLSGRIMAAWRSDGLDDHPRREEILAAVASHDDGWEEPDREPIWSAEGPLDFITAPTDVRLGVWPRGVARVRERHGPFAAALVARHPLALFEAFGRPPEADDLVRELHRRIDDLVREDGTAREDVEAAYRFVARGDLLSLRFCTGSTGERLEVSPDPFEGCTVALAVPARRIPKTRYPSPVALREAWERAEIVVLEGVAAGA